MSSHRTHGLRSASGTPADALLPKLIGSATPSMTQASPSSKRSTRGTRSRIDAGTRDSHRSGGSLTWVSASIRRYPAPPSGAPAAVVIPRLLASCSAGDAHMGVLGWLEQPHVRLGQLIARDLDRVACVPRAVAVLADQQPLLVERPHEQRPVGDEVRGV